MTGPGVPAVLAFHVGEPAGVAHRIVWDGRALAYTRYREGFEPLLASRHVPDAAAWTRFAAALDRLAPWAWPAGGPADPDGPAWSLELSWGGREARASGTGPPPAGFAGFKRAIWALLGDPPAV